MKHTVFALSKTHPGLIRLALLNRLRDSDPGTNHIEEVVHTFWDFPRMVTLGMDLNNGDVQYDCRCNQ